MASKLREDLPAHPNEKYTKEMIKIFDMYREDYKDEVERVKKIYFDTVLVVDSESEKFEGLHRGLMINIKTNKNSQLLTKYTPKKMFDKDLYTININRDFDTITAFYLPENLAFFHLEVNEVVVGTYTGNSKIIDLEILLKESLNLPFIPDEKFWETILWKSKQKKYGIAHTQEEKIEINGIVYNRRIFIQPHLPMAQCPFSQIRLILSEKRDIYIEGTVLTQEYRSHNEMKVGWQEDKTNGIPLIRIKDGIFQTIYESEKIEPNGGLFDSNKELIENLPKCEINTELFQDIKILFPEKI